MLTRAIRWSIIGEDMGDSTLELAWFRAVGVRASLLGAALGVVGLGGGSLVLTHSGPGSTNAAVLIVAILLPLGVGIWAGAPDADREAARLRERWLAAAAFVAVAGSFSTFADLYQQIYPGPWWRMVMLLVVISAPVYALGLLLPVLLHWAEGGFEEEGAHDPLRTALVPLTGGVLAGVVVGVLLTAFLVLPRWNPAVLLMLLALLLLVPLVLDDPARAPIEEEVVYQAITPFGTWQVIDVVYPGERQPERKLFLNGEEESGQLVRSGAPTLPYIAAAEHWLTRVTPAGAGYLFLGGGAYTLPRRIVERDRRAHVVVVELDPEATRIAQRYFGLTSQHGVTSIEGDARAYLERYETPAFDRIYVDVYGGREALPYSLVTREAAALLAQHLAPGGLVALNLIGSFGDEHERQVWSIIHTFAQVFPSIGLYTHLGEQFPGRQNLLLVGALEPERAFPERAGYFEVWPREEWPHVPGVTIFRDLHDSTPEADANPARKKKEDRVSLSSDS